MASIVIQGKHILLLYELCDERPHNRPRSSGRPQRGAYQARRGRQEGPALPRQSLREEPAEGTKKNHQNSP